MSVFICRYLNINAKNAGIILSCLKKHLVRVKGNVLPAEAKMLPNRFRYSVPWLRKVNRNDAAPAATIPVRIRGINERGAYRK